MIDQLERKWKIENFASTDGRQFCYNNANADDRPIA